DPDLGWSAVDAFADARTWEIAAPLRGFAASHEGGFRVGYRRASGRSDVEACDVTVVVVEGKSCLGSRMVRQYTWVWSKADPRQDWRTDPRARALVRRRGSADQRERFLRGDLSAGELVEVEAGEVFDGFPVPDGVLVG